MACLRRAATELAVKMPLVATFRQLQADDAAAFQALRLQALRVAPTAFAASFEEERERTEQEIASRIIPKAEVDRFVIGAFEANHGLVGIGGFFREPGAKVRHIGWVWGLFVAPAFQGNGLGRELVIRVLHTAREIPGLVQLQIRVGTHNASAQKLYESIGFKQMAVLPKALRVEGRTYDEALLLYAIDGP
jgi:RimJ/RimL family protein N-acetyltransferase